MTASLALHNNDVGVTFLLEQTRVNICAALGKKPGVDLLWGSSFRVRPKLETVKGKEMAVSDEFRGLRFPCECVSAKPGGYSDPWADVTKRKLLPNGTKEEILNLIAREPKTISQLAEALNLSAPSVHTHINEMIKSELLRESQEWEKKYPIERYYEPNFPVFRAEECAEFKALCDEMSKELVAMFESKRKKMEGAFRRTRLSNQGWELSDVTHCLYANMYRGARTLLEQRGLLSPRQKHKNGAAWIFWAQEPDMDG